MEISKEIAKIEFNTFAELVNATLSFIVRVTNADKTLSERHYKEYEQRVLAIGDFKEDKLELTKEVLRNQFAYIQSLHQGSPLPISINKKKTDDKTVNDIKDWVKLGVLTPEEADVEKVSPPDWMLEMQNKYKDIK